MNRFLVLVAVAVFAFTPRAPAQVVDDQYVRIYMTIQDADSLSNNGQTRQALSKYLEAQTALQRLQKLNPTWNPSVVNFRLNYLTTKIADLSSKVPAQPTNALSAMPAPAPPPSAQPPPKSAPVSEAEAQLIALRQQVRQLQAEKVILESKLKESLAAQPAPLDARQLARAQDQIKTLQRENELLKVTVNQSKSGPTMDARTAEQTKAALAEANRKLAEQTDKANLLALERTALQQKVKALTQEAGSAATLETVEKRLEQTNRQLADQKELNARLTRERDSLQARTNAPAAGDDTAALRAENQLLKKQLADLTTGSAPGRAGDSALQLAQAHAQIAALQSDKDILRLEKLALENRVKQLPAPAGSPVVTSTVLPESSKAADAARIKRLEQERDELQKKLGAANKELYGRGAKATASRVQELENQVTVLRARLEMFEARRSPYTAEELALFRRPPPVLATPDPKTGKKSIKEMPAGSATLVAEAERYFSARQFDKAEDVYQKVLRQDEKNVPTLANLAAIQLAQKRYDDAEKNIRLALSLAPDDAYSQLVLGQLKLSQGKFDEAVDVLSTAAKLEPQNAQIQNFLGMALNEKGLRGPAETALRRAIQLQPGYGNAHYSLAVVYATQQPPHIELAKWHYQKALAAGVIRNDDLERLLDPRNTVRNVQ